MKKQRSKPGRPSRNLPKAALNKRQPPKPSVPQEPELCVRLRSLDILLAEDNHTNRRVALAFLRKLGLSADAVLDGAEAVQALERVPYDLVFMDCMMPEMDGYEATRRIRSRGLDAGGQTPVIALTANALRGIRESCLEAGMDDHLSKPIDIKALQETLERWRGGRRAAA